MQTLQTTPTDDGEQTADDDDDDDDDDVFAAEALLSVSLSRRDGSSRGTSRGGGAAAASASEGKPRRARKLSAKAAALAELESEDPSLAPGTAMARSSTPSVLQELVQMTGFAEEVARHNVVYSGSRTSAQSLQSMFLQRCNHRRTMPSCICTSLEI